MISFEQGLTRLTSDVDTATHVQPTLFLLSFRQRDELAAIVARGGWQVVAARRGEGVDRRFHASGSGIALIDARGAFEDGIGALKALRDAVDRPAIVLACVSRHEIARLDEVYDAGATHFLASPFGEAELLQALRFATRGVAPRQGAAAAEGLLGWRWDPARRRVQLSPMLARLAGSDEAVGVRAAIHALPVTERRSLFASLRTIAGTTALVQNAPPLGRIVHHLQHDARTGRLLGLVEPLGAPPDVAMLLRDSMPRLRDEATMRRWIERTLNAGRPVHLVVIGLSRLEMVNIAYGRAVGDRLLQSAARRIEEAVAGLDAPRPMIVRLGGADFALASTAPLDAAIGPIEAALDRAFVVEGMLMPIGANIRVVESRAGDDPATLMLRIAEADGGADDSPASIDSLALQLHAALSEGQVEILWQPQVAIATGAIIGVEALARWRHPALGELGAETLFAAAERAGLELALSEHVQALALREAARWPATLSALRLSINVTAGDVARADFADMLLDRVDASGFPRQRLTVEITESGLMAELGEAAGLLADLRRAGCRVAIDDFGTGYSSLAYLKALPLDYLKIDKALSQDIAGSPRDRIVVRGVIDMARSLGLAVVAEGVETETQLELLAKEGCQYFQGFLCAPPLGLGALEEVVRGG